MCIRDRDMEEHIKKYLDTVSSVVKGEPHQQLLTTFLGKMIDLYTVMAYHFADAMACLLYTSVKEVSQLIHTNQAYVYSLIKAGLLPALKLGSYKIRKETLERFLAEYEGKDLTNPCLLYTSCGKIRY